MGAKKTITQRTAVGKVMTDITLGVMFTSFSIVFPSQSLPWYQHVLQVHHGMPPCVFRAGWMCMSVSGKHRESFFFKTTHYIHETLKLSSRASFFNTACPSVIINTVFHQAKGMFRPLCRGEAGGSGGQTRSTQGRAGSCPWVVPHTQMVLISNNFPPQHLRAAAGKILRVDYAFYQH